MRRLAGGTTWRGRAFAVLGAALCVAGLVGAERQLLRLGLLALVLPVAGLLTLGGVGGRLRVTRSLDRAAVAPGEPALLTLTVTNTGRLPVGGAVLSQPLTEQVVRLGSAGPATGARRRLGPLRSGESTSASLALTGTVRGRHPLPPAVVTVTDPFGMVRRTGTAVDEGTVRRGADRLTVTPPVTRLSGAPGRGAAGGGGTTRGRTVGTAGEQDATVREYSPGDEVRRIHWRSTAHRGQLMVRSDDDPADAGVTVVLDTRAGAHSGGPGPDGSFEWAVAATASVVAHAAALGSAVELVAEADRRPGRRPVPRAAASGSGRPGVGAGGGAARRRTAAAALDRLVDVVPRRGGPGDRLTSADPTARRGDVLVAVLGAVGPGDLPELAELRAGRSGAVALLVDVAGWDGNTASRPDVGRGGVGRGEVGGGGVGGTGGVDRVRAALAAAGWQTAVAHRGEDVAQVWAAARATGADGARLRGGQLWNGSGRERASDRVGGAA